VNITITINMKNDAFQPQPGRELLRILRDLREVIIHQPVALEALNGLTLRDSNGNTVGRVEVTE
jgi:hypothetical protein